MAIQLERHLFTLEEYERMVESGGFNEDSRVELIKGEIVDMSPIGFEHGSGVSRLIMQLVELVKQSAVLWVQSPIQIAPNSRPEPDLLLLRRPDDYGDNRPPTPQDVVLLIEVADTSLKYDRQVKGPLYAGAGIPEYWIVNLQEGVLEVYTDPAEGAYKRVRTVKRGETLALPGGLGGDVDVSDVLGKGKGT